MKTIKLKDAVLIPSGHGQAKHGKKGAIVEVEDSVATSLITRKLAEEVNAPKPGAPAEDKPLDKAALLALSKAALLSLATEAKLAGIDDKNTKEQIADAIIAAQPK
jgi:ribosomal protein L24